MQPVLIVLFGLMAVIVVGMLVRRIAAAARARERMAGGLDAFEEPPPPAEHGFLRRWLGLAGIISPEGPTLFVLLTAAGIVLGLVAAGLFLLSGATALLLTGLAVIPGGIGDLLVPAVYLGPWVLLLVLGCLPWLYVRRRRRERVELIEQDLPLVLDLLATLSESGVGFDGALTRVLDTRLGTRPLAGEFRVFQADLLTGRSRIEALRRLARRIEVSSMSVFISAIVQAEQMGMGIADVLRHQAEDLRNRRRERAHAFAANSPRR